MNQLWRILRQTVTESLEDKLLRLSAALSYYAVFSLAPLLLIAVSIAGAVFGADAASGVLAQELEASMGREAAAAVQELVRNARKPSDNLLAAVIGVSMLVFGAGGVFVQLQDALNTVWGLQLKPGTGVRGMIQDRLQSFSMVLGAGFLLLVSLALTTMLQGASALVAEIAPLHPMFWTLLSSVVSFLVVTLLFAAIFRVLPDADIAWSDVWLGAVATSVLFTIGKFGLSWYLGREATTSSYGSAGAFILILLWVHYSSLILLFGAEFTQVHAALRGRHITPNDRAVRVELTEAPPAPSVADAK
jgi:membrane protein